MIAKLNHVCIYVLDQDSAFDFYVNKLGFKVHTDVPMGPGMRWLTVTPPEQPDLEIILSPIQEGMMWDKETTEQMRVLVKKGTFGSCIFQCKDLEATYNELKAKRVQFTKTPKKEFYGYEAIFVDDSGNWFSLGQKEIKS
ncbi:VOC family protein [Solitalea canadensis]|uniref:Lactoylglutathione lyase-like lyase n=1 Tax=Solitalea canadensis (strain ATCC 29591 / DSM 3403 / JCM 21819 / LMG 8368 / NBRC 15130 / NCIMB 12057 / USAM 9D) TaxID=929556 RepID=H8KY48_SOLCM|nr:VOC family protein [Solitalea canadensis]AFD05786.1 lactoylglutathione lyase-like lyase [Solitalea canadensis DSM 3403]